MKATGIVRKIDELGRVVLPKELRTTLGIDEKDPLEVFVEGDRIILRKYVPGCSLCDSVNGLQVIRGKRICSSCVSEIAESRGVLV